MSNITAYDFSRFQSEDYGFGTGSTAEALREIADRIASGVINVQKVHVTSIARGDEFTESVLVLRFDERQSEIHR